ncbi:hypothetical protein [Streptomyces paromomycinus]|uniref:Secreted protein n=1 Tax=Streptomyces paromomycinus TaxID=92743 RepID=A0A401W543_STREY|nr:hypothetical protein [Streptomyces paromomycinus]GCD44416.1 hypothetical protein GKJPGBOP_04112 [Streptomyces paromomycinus]
MKNLKRLLLIAVASVIAVGAMPGSASAYSKGSCSYRKTLSVKTYGGHATVKLLVYRCKDGHDWTMASMTSNGSDSEGALWMDVSRNGGKTWKGLVQKRRVTLDPGDTASIANNKLQNDGPGYSVRACGYFGNNKVYCTKWN